MKVDLRELVETSGVLEGDESVAFLDPVGEEIVAPCHVRVEYRQSQGTLHFSGAVATTLLTQCHRCLDPVRQDVAGEFDVMVRRGEHAAEAGDDVVALPLNQYEIDLEPYVHEAVVLATPMLVLCREDCRGLCPSCGVNWNRETCSCRPSADSRWDALRK
ncbi:MAG TPA: DUF177 domain-containing protein [Candidatus Krumholzibacteria bacterium]|nr:DUF177 domain-containing protein [Candidatus Krumholzibacteria bacterium]